MTGVIEMLSHTLSGTRQRKAGMRQNTFMDLTALGDKILRVSFYIKFRVLVFFRRNIYRVIMLSFKSLVAVYVEGGKQTRIISARPATRAERKLYEQA